MNLSVSPESDLQSIGVTPPQSSTITKSTQRNIGNILRLHTKLRKLALKALISEIRFIISNKKEEFHIMMLGARYNPELRKLWLLIDKEFANILLGDTIIQPLHIEELMNNVTINLHTFGTIEDPTRNIVALKREISALMTTIPDKMRFDLTDDSFRK